MLSLAPAARAEEAEDRWKAFVAQGQYAANANDHARAEQEFLKAVHEAERFGTDDWRVGVTLESLGQTYSAENKFGEADGAYRRSLSIIETANGEDSIEAANVNFDIGANFLNGGHPDEAVGWVRKALSTYERLLGGTASRTAGALCLLGDSLRLGKNLAEAEESLRRCADLREMDGGIDSLELASALHGLALAYVADKKYALAEPRLQLAEKIREKKLGLTSLLLAQTMEDHAALLKTLGRDKEAARLSLLAGAIRRRGRKDAP